MTKLIKALYKTFTDKKMNSRSQYTCFAVFTLLLLSLISACTGINDKQLEMDPVFSESTRVHESLTLKRAEFHQLEKEYAMTVHPAQMRRMEELTNLVRKDLVIASYLQKHYRYYRNGLDKKRWDINQEIYNLCRKTLCQMLLSMGELQMVKNDNKIAFEIFHDLIAEFTDDIFQEYVDQARNRLQELEKNSQYANSLKTLPANIN